MNCTLSVSITIEQAKYLQENKISPSKLIQDALNKLMEGDGN